MFFKKRNEDEVTILKEEFNELTKKAKLYEKISLDEPLRVVEQSQQAAIQIDSSLMHINSQLKDSDTIKTKISDIVDDTKKAIEGSQENIHLGKNLLDTLENARTK